jgi:hypothetical protein
MTDPMQPAEEPPTPEPPPLTGNAAVDDALGRVADSHELGLDEQAESLAAAHERLHAALDADRDARTG